MDLPLHMADAPELLEEVISVMSDKLREVYRLVAKAPIPYVVQPDNITAPADRRGAIPQVCPAALSGAGGDLRGGGNPLHRAHGRGPEAPVEGHRRVGAQGHRLAFAAAGQ